MAARIGFGRVTLGRGFELSSLSLMLTILSFMVGSAMVILAQSPSGLNVTWGVFGTFIMASSIGGLVLGQMIHGRPIDWKITNMEYKTAFRFVAWGFIGVMGVQLAILLTAQTLSVTGGMLTDRIFLAAAGIAEENVFRFMLLGFLLKTGWSRFNAILLSSAMFSGYHLVVYGGSIEFLLAVFASSIVLSLLMIITNRLEVPQIVHGIVNFISVR